MILRLLACALALASPLGAEPTRLASTLFGRGAEIETRDLDRTTAEAAIREAFAAAGDLEGRIGTVSAQPAPGANRVALPPDIYAVVLRARDFCLWSEGAISPAGGAVFRLWAARSEAPHRPAAEALAAAVKTAACDGFKILPATSSIELGPGSALDLADFAIGAAVDRAVEVLRSRGSANCWVEIGGIQRGVGGGPGGRGWPVDLPRFPGQRESLGRILLADRALGIITPQDRKFIVDGDVLAPYFDLRTGEPARTGTVAVLTVTELAVDAQALGIALFALGRREGQFRLGALEPHPAVMWLLGSGEGEPLVTESGWSTVPKR